MQQLYCKVIICSRVWINSVRLPTLLVVSSTGNNNTSLSPFAPENFVPRDGSAVPSRVVLLILHTQDESGAYSPVSSRFPRRRPFIYTANRYRVSPYYSLSGHAIAYRWRSLSRVCRHNASSPQVSPSMPFQVSQFPTPTIFHIWVIGGLPR